MHAHSSAATAPRLERTKISPVRKPFGLPAFSPLLGCLVLVAAVVACYNPVEKNSFIRFDDDRYIVDNPHVKSGLTAETVKWAFVTYDEANYHPLTWLSHALDCKLFRLNPAGHHFISVLIHALNATLLFLLLQYATGYRWRSLMVAALFALHPMNVESVAWAAERKNVLSMLFFLLALGAYAWYARRPGVSRYLTVAGFFLLSLLSKPQVITFPCLLLLWDYWPLSRVRETRSGTPIDHGSESGGCSWPRLLLEKLPLFLLSAISAAITVKAQKAGGAVKNLAEYSILLRIETAVVSYVRYIGKIFWPSKLAGLYPHPTALYPAWQFVGAALALVLITILVIMRASRQRYLAVGWFWFLGSLVPMIGLVQVGFQAMADRYSYLPFIGLFLMLVWTIADWAAARRVSHLSLVAGASCCLLALSAVTHHQIGYWNNTATFWRHTLAVTEGNYVAEGNLGEVLFSQGEDDEAAAHFRAALAVRPEGLVAHLDLGAYEDRRGNYEEAIKHYQAVITHAGDVGMRATAYGSLGFVYRNTGQPSKARQCFETSIQLDDSRARARIGLGLVAQDAGNIEEAIHDYAIAAGLQPSVVVQLLLAQALQIGGHSSDAKATYDRVAASSGLASAQAEANELLSRK